MIRAVLAAAAAAATLTGGAALAQSTYYSDDLGGVIVEGQPRDAYIMRVTTAGKTDHQIRSEIRDVAWIACTRAPRTGNIMDNRPSQLQWCANQASSDALSRFSQMSRARRFVDVSANYYTPYD